MPALSSFFPDAPPTPEPAPPTSVPALPDRSLSPVRPWETIRVVSATDTAEPGVVKGESVYSRVERLLSSQSASASVPSSSTLSTSGLDVSSFINKRSTGNEVCALHLSVWKNDLKMVNLLLDYGADPDVADGESGWSSLHRACYFGYLGLVTRLLQAKASTKVEDRRGRTPFDLLSQ